MFSDLTKKSLPTRHLTALLGFLLPLIVFLLYANNFFQLASNAIDMPWGDEWSMLPDTNASRLSLTWLFTPYKEHLAVLTRLQMWIHYYLFGMDVVLHMLTTYLLYGAVLIMLYYFLRKHAPHFPGWMAAAFLVFFLTSLNSETPFSGSYSAWHYCILFWFLSVWLLFHEKQGNHQIFWGCLAGFLSATSQGIGLGLFCVTVCLFLVFKCLRLVRASVSRPGQSAGEMTQMLAVALMFMVVGVLWYYNYRRNGPGEFNQDHYLFPDRTRFWTILARMCAMGFGFSNPSDIPLLVVAFVFAVVLLPLFALGFVFIKKQEEFRWPLATTYVGCVAGMSMVVFARGTMAFGTRFVLPATICMMLCIAILVDWLKNYPRVLRVTVMLLWLMCFSASLDDWNFRTLAEQHGFDRLKGRECAIRYYRGKGKGFCWQSYPHGGIAWGFELGKKLNLSFYRKIKQAELVSRGSVDR